MIRSKVGIGAIVTEAGERSWTTPEQFHLLLDNIEEDGRLSYIDSAEAYVNSEAEIGKWLGKDSTRRKRFCIGTKFSARYNPKIAEKLVPFTREMIIERFSKSLQSLRCDDLDVYWLHAPHESCHDWDPIVEAFVDLHSRRLIRAAGVCNIYDKTELMRLVQTCKRMGYSGAIYLQNEFHLIYADQYLDLMKESKRLGLINVAFSPSCAGVLSGKYTYFDAPSKENLPENSRMWAWSKRLPQPFWSKKVFEAIDEFQKFAETLKVEPFTLAVAYVLTHPFIDHVLIGPKNCGQLPANLDALNLHLTNEQRLVLEQLFAGKANSITG